MGLDPYRDPILYDLEYSEQQDDVEFYLGLARRIRGPVLELGCGNGRVTIPLARAGVEVHGLDASETMLTDLEGKLRAEPMSVRLRVRTTRGDFTRLEPGQRYPLVILPFNAIHHCRDLGQVRALLSSVRGVLRPGGTFALDCYLPDPVLYARDPTIRHEERTFRHPRTGECLYSWEQGWWDPEKRIHHVIYVYEREDGHRDDVHLELFMFERVELLELLRQEGFEIAWQGSDFRGTPLRANSLKWVMELRPR